MNKRKRKECGNKLKMTEGKLIQVPSTFNRLFLGNIDEDERELYAST